MSDGQGSARAMCEVLRDEAKDLIRRGTFDRALALLKRAEAHARDRRDLDELQSILGDIAGVYRFQEDFAESLRALDEQDTLLRTMDHPVGLQACLGNRAVLLREIAVRVRDVSRLRLALELAQEQRRLCERHEIVDGLQFAVGTEALIRRDLGELAEAGRLFGLQVQILRESGNRLELARALLNLAAWNVESGQRATAETLIREAEEAARSTRSDFLLAQAKQLRHAVGMAD